MSAPDSARLPGPWAAVPDTHVEPPRRWHRLLERAKRWSVVTVVAQTTATLTAMYLLGGRGPGSEGLFFIPFVAGLLVVGGLVQFRRSVQHATREGMTTAARSEIWLWGVLSAMPSFGPLAEVKLLTGAARAVERDTGAVDVLPRVRRLAVGRLVCAFLSWPLMAYFFMGGSSMLAGGLLGLPTLVCLALAMRTTTGALEEAAAVDVSALAATGARSPVAFATLSPAGVDAAERVPPAAVAERIASDRRPLSGEGEAPATLGQRSPDASSAESRRTQSEEHEDKT